MGEEAQGVSARQRLVHAKHKIKTWEGEYKATYGCPPDREAMAQAPQHIRHAYKTYRYYRKAAAEQSLASHGAKRSSSGRDEDILSRSDSCDLSSRVSVSCGGDVVASPAGEGIRGEEVVVGSACDAAKVLTSDVYACPVVERKADCENSSHETECSTVTVTDSHSKSAAKSTNTFSGIWGRHLNKDSECPVAKDVKKEASVYSKMAEKLRAKSTIKMRKSLRRSSSINKSQSKLVSSQSMSQASVCDESNDASSESRLSCNGDSSLDKLKAGDEGTLQDNTNTTSVESDEVFFTNFSNTVDEPLSIFDAIERTCDTTFTPSHDTTSDELTPLSILEAAQPNSCRTPSIHNNTSKPKPIGALDAMELDSVENVPKYHEITSREKAPVTQPISVLSTLSQTHTLGLSGIKKRASLNLGWLARCTGTPLDDTFASKQDVPQENWKIKLTDKVWSEEADENEEPQESPPIEQDYDECVYRTTTSNSKPTENTVKKVAKNTRKKATNNTVSKGVKKKVDKTQNKVGVSKGAKRKADISPPTQDKVGVSKGAKRKVDISPPTQDKVGRVLRTRSARNAAKPNYTIDFSDDEGYSLSDEDDLWQDSGEREESEAEDRMSNFADEELANLEPEPVSQVFIVRKRKKETIEELEEKGKIQPQWPPPKKKRVARKKAVASSSTKKVGKENSPKVKRTVRKRKKIEPEEEEEEEERTPATPSQKSAPSLDYDETDDIESHGTKNTAPRGKYLTGEERMMKKISSGTLNNNYVRINIKKKIFVRGKKTLTGEKYRRQEWKKKQIFKSAEKGNAGAIKTLTCYKCGDFGHWARNCSGKRGDNLAPLEIYNENESTFLSLDDAASMALGIKKVDPGKPVIKMYPNAKESEGGDGNTVNASNDGDGNTVHASNDGDGNTVTASNDGDGNAATASNNGESDTSHRPSSESQEEPRDAEEKESETVSGEGPALPANIDQEEDVHDRDDNTESQDTDTQQTNNEAEYEFNDSDDDIFANMEETDFVEQQHEAPSSTQSSSSSTVPPSAPRSYNSSWYQRPTVEPLYPLSEGEVIATPEEVHDALRMFGYPSFRPGQERAIMRILSGQSTLLVLSTGSGKSLCYQLPAYLYSKRRSPCITLCVSPLVSLMEDQITGLPQCLRAVCLHTHQNPTQRSHAIAAIHSRAAHILLVSPEAVVASRTGGVLGTLLKELPPVAFACLDEAHCVSEWSHNFRPSYLRVCQVLRERLGVKTILGLTATARIATARSIARHLLISDFDAGVIRGTSVPENLQLSVSRDRNREEAMVALLQGERFSGCSSIIIYCTRRDECERVATLIRTQLHDPSKVDVKSNLKRSRGLSYDAEAYHAGLSSYRRQQVQKRFMSDKLRIVVATVAFGMGIDKSDVQGIIHFNMPRNVESYVQEIGRAGRDGEEAHCHLFLDDQDGRDTQELKRHIFANSLDRHTIRKLLDKIFKPCTCAKLKSLSSGGNEKAIASNMPCSPVRSTSASEDIGTATTYIPSDPFTVPTTPSACPGHEVAIPIDRVVQELDLPEENLETLLCYLELHQENLIHINSHVYANCKVSCYGGPRQLVAVSRRCPPLAVAIALERQKGTDFSKSNNIAFPVVEVSSRMGWNSKIVKRELKSLEWNTEGLQGGGKVKRSGVVVEMTDLSFHLEARGDLSDDERDQVLDAVYHRTQVQEQNQLRQLNYTYQLLRSISHSTILFCCDTVDQERCSRLRIELREYFRTSEALSELHTEDKVSVKPEVESGIRSSVRAFLSTYEDQQWTGRAMARVFHGIASPNYPAQVWGRVRRYWRQHLNIDFNALVSIATQEILRCK